MKEPGLYPMFGSRSLLRAAATAKGTAEFAKLDDVAVFCAAKSQTIAAPYSQMPFVTVSLMIQRFLSMIWSSSAIHRHGVFSQIPYRLRRFLLMLLSIFLLQLNLAFLRLMKEDQKTATYKQT